MDNRMDIAREKSMKKQDKWKYSNNTKKKMWNSMTENNLSILYQQYPISNSILYEKLIREK